MQDHGPVHIYTQTCLFGTPCSEVAMRAQARPHRSEWNVNTLLARSMLIPPLKSGKKYVLSNHKRYILRVC